MADTKTKTKLSDTTRFLLTLWDLGGVGQAVKHGDVTKRIVPKGHKKSEYQPLWEQLSKDGVIDTTKGTFSLTSKGVDLLGESLNNSDFGFTSNVGAKTANALLKWIRDMGATISKADSNGKGTAGAIGSYEAFKTIALETYDRLNKDYNLDNLVPIYRIRREIGDRVSRSQFNEWMLELQANDILQLIGGEMPGLTSDIAEDSIETKLGGARYYTKLL